MATAATALVTFAEFEQLPDPPGSRLELHNGEVIDVPPPAHDHKVIQRSLRRALERELPDDLVVETEVGFKLGASDYRVADVAVLRAAAWNSVPPGRYLDAAPELVVEVLSPSNSAIEMMENEQLCLDNGCLQFWIVNPKNKTVRISTPNGPSTTWKSGEQIPLLYGGTLAADAIFA